MEKIDRLGWAAGVSMVAHGVRIGVRTKGLDDLSQVLAYLPPGWKSSSTPTVDHLYSLILGGAATRPNVRLYNLLYAGPLRLARTMDLRELLDAFENHLQLLVAEMAPRRVFVHAGVVDWRGQALVLPGHSFSGKTTLVSALLRAGATYYSDEYAVFDPRGYVYPYVRPLSVRRGANGSVERCSPEALGGKTGVKPLPVGLVVLTHYRPGAHWRPRSTTMGKSVLGLLAHTVAARRKPGAALKVLQQVVAQARVLTGGRGEAEEIVAPLLRHMEG